MKIFIGYLVDALLNLIFYILLSAGISIFAASMLYYFLIIEYQIKYHKNFILPFFKRLKKEENKRLFLNAMLKNYISKDFAKKLNSKHTRYYSNEQRMFDKIKNDFKTIGVNISMSDFCYMDANEELECIRKEMEVLSLKEKDVIKRIKKDHPEKNNEYIEKKEKEFDKIFEIENS